LCPTSVVSCECCADTTDCLVPQNVLQRTDECLIVNTVKGLSVQVIVPLVRELSHRVHGNAHRYHMVSFAAPSLCSFIYNLFI